MNDIDKLGNELKYRCPNCDAKFSMYNLGDPNDTTYTCHCGSTQLLSECDIESCPICHATNLFDGLFMRMVLLVGLMTLDKPKKDHPRYSLYKNTINFCKEYQNSKQPTE